MFGKPTQRRIDVWEIERRAQAAAFKAIAIGATCESVDAAARKVIVDAGFGPGYKVPGLPHRTGHGIGLDGHEWTNFVKGNKTPIQPGIAPATSPCWPFRESSGFVWKMIQHRRGWSALLHEAEPRHRPTVAD